ncbi:hypothetical protein AKO1_005585 [Acrasis kona]|uniref:N-acetyltransferase domain-containing protein n=1 Tax=Acrasis kona TaxID=1008807 RepID=A0AAW2ZKZ1_9EUKA
MSILTPLESLPSKDTTLIGDRIVLKPMKEEYADELFQVQNDSIWDWMFLGPYNNVEQYRSDLKSNSENNGIVSFVVVDKATDKKIGQLNYINIVPKNRTIELGSIWYSPEYHRTYANSESVLLALTHAFEVLGYRRVEWKCDSRNEKSKAAAQKLGFTFEGLFRQHMIIKGNSRDTSWFSIIDSEWPSIKLALQERITRNNLIHKNN